MAPQAILCPQSSTRNTDRGATPASLPSSSARVMGGVTRANSPAGASARSSSLAPGRAACTAPASPEPRTYQAEARPSGDTVVSSPPSAQNTRFFSSRCLAASITSATTAEAVGSLPAPRP